MQGGTQAQALPVGRTSPLRSPPATFKPTTRFWAVPDCLVDRPFTDPRETVSDAVVMADMLARERVVARTWPRGGQGPGISEKIVAGRRGSASECGEMRRWRRDTGMHGGTKAQALPVRVRPLAQARNQVVEEDVEPDLRRQADPDQLIRLFLNLLDNAVKFTDTGGRIGLTGRRNGASIEVEVSDTGTGIGLEHLESIFDRFYRVEESRDRDSGGHGLGLALAHEIARAHGGTLTAQVVAAKDLPSR